MIEVFKWSEYHHKRAVHQASFFQKNELSTMRTTKMDISSLLWKFVNVVNTQTEKDVLKTSSFQTLAKLVHRNSKVWIHTSYLPHIPYENNTYLCFDNIEKAFEALYKMYSQHAHYTQEGKQFIQAYKIMKGEYTTMNQLCEDLGSLMKNS
jgi:hypothetical protein